MENDGVIESEIVKENFRPIKRRNIEHTTIDQLNDDCLEGIFIKLPLRDRLCMGRVCKRWQQITQQAWSDIKEMELYYDHRNNLKVYLNNLYSFQLNDQMLKKILICFGRFLTKLKIEENDCMMELERKKILSEVTEHCYNLKKLTILLKLYPGTGLDDLFLRFKKLEFVAMIISDDVRYYRQCLLNLAKLKIKEMSLLHRNDAPYNSFPQEVFEFRYLQDLELGCLNLPENSEMIDCMHTLTHLSLFHCTITKPFDTSIGHLKNLEFVRIYGSSDAPDELLNFLSKNCMKIKCLVLEKCPKISDRGLSAITKIPTIEELILRHLEISGDGFSMMKTLKILNCDNCRNIRDQSIIALIKTAPNLEEINVIDTGVTSEILRVGNKVSHQRWNGIPLKITVYPDVYKPRDDQLLPLI